MHSSACMIIQVKLVQSDVNIHLHCINVDEEGVAGGDLSRDDNTLFTAREGLLRTYKKTYGQFTLYW